MARQRGKSWQADIRDKAGKRYRHTFPTKQEAQAWEAQARLASSQGKPLPPVPSIIKKNPHMAALDTLQGLFDYVVRTDWGNAQAAQTLIKNGRDVVAFFGGHNKPAFITSQGITNFKTCLEKRGAQPATINRKLSALSKLLKVAYGMGLIERMPLINWEREEKTKFRYLNEEELDKFYSYWQSNFMGEMRRLSLFMVETGARLSEALRLEWGDITEGEASVTFWRTKTGKPRTLPLTERCSAMLRVLQKSDFTKARRVFGTSEERRNRVFAITPHDIRKKWLRMQRDLDWPDVTPHTLRHTCCTRLVSRGVDIKRVMEWMGHSNISTTQRYMQISPQGLADVVHVLEETPQPQQIAA